MRAKITNTIRAVVGVFVVVQGLIGVRYGLACTPWVVVALGLALLHHAIENAEAARRGQR